MSAKRIFLMLAVGAMLALQVADCTSAMTPDQQSSPWRGREGACIGERSARGCRAVRMEDGICPTHLYISGQSGSATRFSSRTLHPSRHTPDLNQHPRVRPAHLPLFVSNYVLRP